MATPTPRRHPLLTYVLSIFVLLLAVSLPGFVRAEEPVTRIMITDLGNLGGDFSQANGINNRGQIAGMSATADDSIRAFLWQNGTMTDLGTLGGDSSGASDINDQGQIVGGSATADGSIRPFLWQNGTMTDLGTFGGCCGQAFGINDRGQVVGWSNPVEGESGFLWQNGTMTDIGGFTPYAINNHGQIVGDAVLWENGTMIDLGSLGGWFSQAYAINNHGQIVGFDARAIGDGHAFLWENGTMIDLGSFGGHTQANDINDHGQIIVNVYTSTGTRAYLLENSTLTSLGTLGGASSWAMSLNEQGQIVGSSTTETGEWHAVLWTLSRPSASPLEQIQAIKAQVHHLMTSKVLNKGQAHALMTKLDGAITKLERGNNKAAANQLKAFVNQVNAFHKSRKLSTAQAQPLMDAANRIIAELRQ